MGLSHLVGIRDLSESDLDSLFLLTDRFLDRVETRGKDPETVIGLAFEEGSTRTRLSFLLAARKLQLTTVDVSHWQLSLSRAESLRDHVRTMGLLGVRVLVMRTFHPFPPNLKDVAEMSGVLLLNAGDGDHEHPTQALLDVYTITRRIGDVKSLNLALAGDLRNHRAAHSLNLLLAHLGVSADLVAPSGLEMPDAYCPDRDQVRYRLENIPRDLWQSFDVVCVFPFMPNRREEYVELFGSDAEALIGKLHFNSTILNNSTRPALLHPFPRHGEVSEDLDDSRYDLYSWQQRFGVALRGAVLTRILGLNEGNA